MVPFEVEQKFDWTLATSRPLHQGIAPHHHCPLKIEHLEHRTFQDTCYDSNNTLCENGLWVRMHQSFGGVFQWEAKQLQRGSSLLRSTYDPVRRSLSSTEAGSRPSSDVSWSKLGLWHDNFCQFQTSRHSLRAKGTFAVVLDSTDSGYQVGQVELMVEDADLAHADIDASIEKLAWFFDTQTEPKGKLTAYFKRVGYPKEV